MSQELRFDDRVVVITGAGQGLGRCHARLFSSRGAKVVVNDLGGGPHGGGGGSSAADEVVREIREAGGEAVANYDSVVEGGKIVDCALDHYRRLDVVVNNAGILRDKSFAKMSQEDWDLIYEVHVLGAFRVTHAAWPRLREGEYGRVIFTASAAGIYGNFGQANYSFAKLGLHGLCQTLALEGQSRNIRVNTVAPVAGSRLTATILPPEMLEALKPEYVSPLVLFLCHEECNESGGLFEVGAGWVGKLRWERSRGHAFALSAAGSTLTPENVAARWDRVVNFTDATHPTDTTSALEPVLSNLKSSQPGGGNEFIDVGKALGYEYPVQQVSYEERDVSLYALGVGAAADPLDPQELPFVYERHGDGFKTLPSFGVIPPLKLALSGELKQAPGLNYGFERILHGEQYLELSGALPTRATLTVKSKIKDIFDKGKNAMVVTETRLSDEEGRERILTRSTTVVVGAGGWGGERGPSSKVNLPPERAPDAVVQERVADNQALLYRLSGDWNPLHVDPGMAKNFGFDKPILHGLCTFGYVSRHLLRRFCDNDPGRFKSIQVRFSDSVFPGETLVTEMWDEGEQRVVFCCKVKERDRVVISNAALEFLDQAPELESTEREGQEAGDAGDAGDRSAAVFRSIGEYVAQHSELVSKVGGVFQFKLSSPDHAWVLDLKSGDGRVYEGEAESADCTLILSNENFLAMVAGKKDAQRMFFGGELKLAGNMALAQKLTFLGEIRQS